MKSQSDPDPWKNPYATEICKKTQWTPYDRSKVYMLEKALLKGESTCKILNLLIDLKKMVQINEQDPVVKERPIIRAPRAQRIAMSRVRKDRVQQIDLEFIDSVQKSQPGSSQMPSKQSEEQKVEPSISQQQYQQLGQLQNQQLIPNSNDKLKHGYKDVQYTEIIGNLKIEHFFLTDVNWNIVEKRNEVSFKPRSSATIINPNDKKFVYLRDFIIDQRHSLLPNRHYHLINFKEQNSLGANAKNQLSYEDEMKQLKSLNFLNYVKRNPFLYQKDKYQKNLNQFESKLQKIEELDYTLPDFILKSKKQILVREFTERAFQLLGHDAQGNKKDDFSQQDLSQLISEGIIAHGKQLDIELGFQYNDQIGLGVYNDLCDAQPDKYEEVLLRQYTEECFLYKDINKMLRESRNQTEEQFAKIFKNLFPYYLFFLQAQRFLLIKSESNKLFSYPGKKKQCIEQKNFPQTIKLYLDPYKNQITLYRGATLPPNFIEDLKQKQKKLLRFNEILSTTFNKEKALEFATNALFIFNVEGKVTKSNYGQYLAGQEKEKEEFEDYKYIAKYAVSVDNISAVKGEEEVIFPSGIVVQVDKVEKRNNISEIEITIALEEITDKRNLKQKK